MAPEFGGDVLQVDRADGVAGVLGPQLADGDTVLVKASRGVGLEIVAKDLAAQRG
jgi:UDP-N-acetylmuramoyl-tripeptide--D-alanyl-D-alanine ligase